MRALSASRKQRILTGVTAVLMLAFLLLAAFLIAAEADHECSGEDCPICACIRQCERTLENIGGGKTERVFALLCVLLLPVLLSAFHETVSRETLVAKKIRLNN